SANVKQAATITQRLGHQFNGSGKVRCCSAQRILNEFLFLDKKLDQLCRAHLFEVLRARIALFSKRGGQIFYFILRKHWLKRNWIERLGCKPCSTEFGRSLRNCHTSVWEILFYSTSKGVRVDRVAVKEASHQRHFGRK